MIEVELRPEVEARLAAEAKAKGVEVKTYIETLLEEAVFSTTHAMPPQPTGEDMRLFFQAMTADSAKIPQLPDEAFQRENFYQDHD